MIKRGFLKKLIDRSYLETDSDSEILKKSIVIIMVIAYSLVAIIFGTYFIWNGFVAQGIIPLGYAFVSLFTFRYFVVTRKYEILCASQLTLVLILPFLLHIVLGGFSQSSGMLLWSCTVPFLARFFYDVEISKKWFFALIVLLILACVLDESARIHFPKEVNSNSQMIVYGANFILASGLLFYIQLYFSNEQKKILKKLKGEQELTNALIKIKKQKEMLFASHSNLEIVMGSLEEVFWARDLPDYKMKYVSDSVESLYGFSKKDWFENPNLWIDAIHPDDRKEVIEKSANVFTQDHTELSYRIITADRKIKNINSKTRVIKRDNGCPFLMTGVARDVTDLENSNIELEKKVKERTSELVRSEKKLKNALMKEKELNKLKSSFVSVASHQFRTPLSVIQSNAQLLEMIIDKKDTKESDKHKQVVGRIKSAISGMTELMNDVLLIGSVEAGKTYFKPENIDLKQFCNNLETKFNLIQDDKRILMVNITGEASNFYSDPKLLDHVLSNLIDNAFKFSVGQRNPELCIDCKSTEVVFLVKDYGIGFKEEHSKNLFEPFFRADNTLGIKGTGLGLNIVKEYVELINGIVTFKSQLDKGSEFKIFFKKNNYE